MTCDTSEPSPEPSRALVVMIPTPQMPVGTNTTPMSLVISVQCAQTVSVHTNAPVSSPHPLVAAVEMVVVIITPVQMPVASHIVPMASRPPPVHAQSVPMPTNLPVAVSPEPTRPAVVVVMTPQVPVRAYTAPVALVVSVQRSQSVQVHTDSAESAPPPLVASVQMMIVVIPAVQMPIRTDSVPPGAIPPLQDAQAVQMASNTAVTSPEPMGPFVVMVATPHMPIGADAAPVALVIPVKSPEAVEVHANAPESSPSPGGATVVLVIVMVSPPQVPIAAHVVPARTVPAPVDSQPVQVPSHPSVGIPPKPSRSFVIMFPSPKMPICSNPSPVALVITVQCAQAVQVDTNTAISTPLPSVPAMKVVVVVVATIQMPVAAHIAPVCASPTLVHPETVSMAANLAVVVGPEPARTLVVMVATPQMPI